MESVLFNFHDIVLILTGFEFFFIGAYFLLARNQPKIFTYSLAGFAICFGLAEIHELIFWGASFRAWVLNISPNLFFWGNTGYFLQGPFLFYFVLALTRPKLKFRLTSLVHFMPAAIYIVYMFSAFYFKSEAYKTELVETQHIVYSAPHLYFDLVSRLLRLLYASYALFLLLPHKGLKTWQGQFLIVVIFLFSWDLVIAGLKLFYLLQDDFNLELLNLLGTTAYHLNFLLLNGVILFGIKNHFTSRSPMFSKVYEDEGKPSDGVITKIDEFMVASKIYREPHLNVDLLAERLDIPSKKLAAAIKDDRQMNFNEFINSYRIEEAKALLEDPSKAEMTVAEIYQEVGFNSKSVFNTGFKKVAGLTPSQYRKLALTP